MTGAKDVERHLDNLHALFMWGYPPLLTLILAYNFAPKSIEDVLFGLPVAYASTGLWLASLSFLVLLLRTIVCIKAQCQNPSEKTRVKAILALRTYPVFVNPFFETTGKFSYVANVLGVVLITVPIGILFAMATQLFYSYTLPALLHPPDNSVLITRAILYLFGQFALIASALTAYCCYKEFEEILITVAGSEPVSRQKRHALIVPLFFLSTSYAAYLFLQLIRTMS